MKKLMLIVLLVFVIMSSPALAVLRVVPCQTDNDCQVMCDEWHIELGSYCTCESHCKDLGRGLECELDVHVYSNLSTDYFKTKATEYVISKVNSSFYENHYKINNVIMDETNGNTAFVSFNYTTEIGEELNVQGISFNGCSGEIERVNIYLGKEPIINRSEAIRIAESQVLEKYVFSNIIKNWRVELNYGRYTDYPDRIIWDVSSPGCFAYIDATNGQVLTYESCKEPIFILISFIILIIIFLLLIYYFKVRK